MDPINHHRFMTWNARSVRGKKDELFDRLQALNISICSVTETFLNSRDSFNHPDFVTYRLD